MFGTEGNSVKANNIVEIRTMTLEQVVQEWATANKITADSVDKLFEDGFTSFEAIKLIDAEDLAKSKMTTGQKNLILACVKALKGETASEKDDGNVQAQVPLQTSGAHQSSASRGEELYKYLN